MSWNKSGAYYIGEFKKGASEILNEPIMNCGARLMFQYAEIYKNDPKHFLQLFFKFNSIRMACCLVIFNARKQGFLKELEGKKDFTEWVEKQSLEAKWKSVLSKTLLIIWGVLNEK